MIISVSRRTDIPACYAQWFFNRIKEGFALVRNPINPHLISRIKLTPEIVDGIVFWTKNPLPMIDKLDLLKAYDYYFQFTLTPYGPEIEPGLPSNKDELVHTFCQLSDRIGPERVIWRYDPIMLAAKYTADFHIQAFEKLTRQLHSYTNKCTISFIDVYRKISKRLQEFKLLDADEDKLLEVGKAFAEIANSYGMVIDACAEKIDLSPLGIKPARCIDVRLFEKMCGCILKIGKDKNQRPECGCAESVDIGMYNTCLNGCRYCYANYSDATVTANFRKHDPISPLLFGEIGKDDVIRDRDIKSCKEEQIRLPGVF